MDNSYLPHEIVLNQYWKTHTLKSAISCAWFGGKSSVTKCVKNIFIYNVAKFNLN